MPKPVFPAATLACLLLAIPVPACSSGNDSSSGGSDLSGTYNTDVTLISSNCPFTVQDNPTTVRATATTVTLTHAGTAYTGILNADSSFVTQEKVVSVGGTSYHITIQGEFTPAGLDAQVTVVFGSTPCTALVHWIGPKT